MLERERGEERQRQRDRERERGRQREKERDRDMRETEKETESDEFHTNMLPVQAQQLIVIACKIKQDKRTKPGHKHTLSPVIPVDIARE